MEVLVGASFLITLREGLEIALVLAILIAYLVKTDRRGDISAVWRGAGLAAACCVVGGVAFDLFVGEFEGKAEQFIEGTIAILAASVLTWMVFWMRKNARGLGAELRAQIDRADSARALATIAFVAVLREGLETVLFLISAETASSSGSSVVFGGLLGLVVAAVLGRLVYAGGNKVNLRSFFNVTGVLLILFAAGLFGKFFHEYRELLGFESGWLVEPAWTITSGAWGDGTFYDFMKGFFGWHNEAEHIRVIAYFAYLVPIGWVFLAGGRTKPTTKTSAEEKVPSHV
ncbi:MAG: iron transporter [Ilumatobacteraceae bacterium]|nr:iron transporter [Ilumatobacteraceae bacterium]